MDVSLRDVKLQLAALAIGLVSAYVLGSKLLAVILLGLGVAAMILSARYLGD